MFSRSVSRSEFTLPNDIKQVGHGNLVDKIRFNEKYINLKNEVDLWNKAKNTINIILLSTLVLVVVWISVFTQHGVTGLINSVPLVFWVIAIPIYGYALFWRRTDYQCRVMWLVHANKLCFEDMFIQYVQSKASVSVAQAGDSIASSKPSDFQVHGKIGAPHLAGNEIIMIGEYDFGNKVVTLAVYLSFNKDYSELKVKNHLLI